MRVAIQNLYDKAFENYKDDFLDNALVASITTAQTSPSITKACKNSGINHWAWEADLYQAMDDGKLIEQLSNQATLKTMEYDPGKNTSRHLHKEYLRQRIACESHYLYDLTYEYLWFKAIHLAMESRAEYSLCYSLFHSFGDHIIAEAHKSIGLPVYIPIPDYIVRSTISEKPYYLMYNYNTHNYVQKSFSTHGLNLQELHVVAKILHNCLERDDFYSSEAVNVIDTQTKNGKNEVLREITYGRNSSSSTLGVTTSIAECKRFVIGSQIESTSYEHPFILWCLNLEPESTINPLGGYFYDTLLFGSILAKICRLAGICLIVREHPAFLTMKIGSAEANAHIFNQPILRPRSIEWYKQILGIRSVKGFDNVSPISTILDSGKCIGIACINGTSCLNSIRRDKLALIGAAAWFSEHKTCATINSEAGIDKAVRLIKAYLENKRNVTLDFGKLSLVLAEQYVKHHTMIESSCDGEFIMPSPAMLLDITSSIKNGNYL